MPALSDRSQRYMDIVTKALEDGFDTESARKDYMGYLGNIYEKEIHDVAHHNLWAMLRPLRDSGNYDDRLKFDELSKIDFPYSLSHVREKMFPNFETYGADVELLKKLIAMRAQLKEYTLKPRASVVKKELAAKKLAANTVIADATAPLKEAAIIYTEKKAREFLAQIKSKLEENDFDPYKVVPKVAYKSIWGPEYQQAKEADERRQQYTMVVNRKDNGYGKEPTWSWSDEQAEKYVKDCKDSTAAHYDAYVAKMNQKIENPVSAKFAWENSAVWGRSILIITKADGTTEKWKTQIIINFSKYGKPFNQWPSRQVK